MSYRLGCCIPGASFMPQTGGEGAYALKALKKGYSHIINSGYDFAEATVGTLTQLTESELDEACDSGIRIEVCNSFVPPSLAFYDTSDAQLYEYVDGAMARMARLGAEYVILGSGAARNVPESVPAENRLARLSDFLRICSGLYGKHGVTVALEPLNAAETNCINKVSEGFGLVDSLNLPGVMLLADAYHMYAEKEPVTVLKDCEKRIVHIHVSQPDRAAPGIGSSAWLEEFASQLKKTKYSQRISVECVFSPGGFEHESVIALSAAKAIFN